MTTISSPNSGLTTVVTGSRGPELSSKNPGQIKILYFIIPILIKFNCAVKNYTVKWYLLLFIFNPYSIN